MRSKGGEYGTFSGATAKDGSFECAADDEGVFFDIGVKDAMSSRLGKGVVSFKDLKSNTHKIFLTDLAGVDFNASYDKKVIALAQFFQSVDADEDVSNGIDMKQFYTLTDAIFHNNGKDLSIYTNF